jgi:hypothetical protein
MTLDATRNPAGLRAIRLRPDNLIPRPWGGFRLAAFKGLAGTDRYHASIGESFEVSACSADAEAGAHPSIALLEDGTELPLPELLRRAAPAILGESLAARDGGSLPLLPKFLDVKSLLSVQAHPPGNPECYVILEADPGATIRVGFRTTADARDILARCRAGRAAQERLARIVMDEADPPALHARLAAALADRAGGVDGCLAALETVRPPPTRADVAALVSDVFATYWMMLDAMHEIPVTPGQVLFNATPPRLRGRGPCSAEVHALGNPEEREILLLEVRKPGVTFRVWDHARFPLRPLQIEEALGALNLEATEPAEFVAGDLGASTPGVSRTLADCPDFAVDHLRVDASHDVAHDTRSGPVTLHGIAGAVTLHVRGAEIGRVGRGESVLVPAATGAYTVRSTGAPADVIAVRVTATRAD